jgi:hypothetical protein
VQNSLAIVFYVGGDGVFGAVGEAGGFVDGAEEFQEELGSGGDGINDGTVVGIVMKGEIR